VFKNQTIIIIIALLKFQRSLKKQEKNTLQQMKNIPETY